MTTLIQKFTLHTTTMAGRFSVEKEDPCFVVSSAEERRQDPSHILVLHQQDGQGTVSGRRWSCSTRVCVNARARPPPHAHACTQSVHEKTVRIIRVTV